MKFLVLGSSGMAGHIISIYLKEQGHKVIGYARRPVNYVESIIGDVKDTKQLKKIIHNGEFDAVINAIGILNQFAERDKATAVFLNAYLPHYLVEITSDLETQIVHMSTDCVFSGKTGGYTEESFPDGQSYYDRSKALGEIEDAKNITLRNSIIGPDINPNGIGLLNWFMKQESSVKGFTNAMWTGLTTLELAKIMELAVKERTSGLYNMVYEESISKYDLLKLFNYYLRNNEIKISAHDNFVIDKSLVRTRFDFKYLVPNYEKMISELATWIRDHKDLYPHYTI